MVQKKASMDTPFKGRSLRVFTIFVIGIILPSTFLIYLGFRSFQYERLLLKKKTEERYAGIADLIQRKVDDRLDGWASALRQSVTAEPFQHSDLTGITMHLLSLQNVGDIPIRHIFVFDEADQMIIPIRTRPYAFPPLELGHEPDWGLLTPEISRLEQLEFAQKNVAEAIKGYLALREKTTNPILQATLLKNIAGGYRKLKNDSSTETTYLELIRRFNTVLDPTGLPMGVVARQLLIEFYEENRQWDRSVNLRLELLEKMILNQWNLTPEQRSLLLSQNQRVLQSLVNMKSGVGEEARLRWNRFKVLQNRMASWGTAAQRFLATEWPSLLKQVRRRQWFEQGGVLHNTHECILVTPWMDPSTGHRKGLVIAVGDPRPLWKTLEQTATQIARSADLRVLWNFQSPAASDINKALWRPSLERSFMNIEPPLTFQFFEPTSDPEQTLLHRRVWVYGGITGMALIVILAGLAMMVQAMRREMEMANLKADFVANVSHELRTPLAAISYISELLNRGRYRSAEEAKEFFQMLGEEAGRLRELIDDVLDFSKMLGGRKVYDRQPLDLVSVVKEAEERFQVKATAKNFSLHVDMPGNSVQICGERKAILQAIINLLDNALKYSGDSREIVLKLTTGDGQAMVSVKDLGIGIPHAAQEKIFEKFYRIEHALSRESEGGVGLGLAMVKHIMEGHDGHVTVNSQPGKGSEFSLWFPLYKQGGPHDTNFGD